MKMNALQKFIGGCLDSINLQYKNLETVVGSMSKVEGTTSAVATVQSSNENEIREMGEPQGALKIARKEVTGWHTRCTTEEGFIPLPEEIDPSVAKLQ